MGVISDGPTLRCCALVLALVAAACKPGPGVAADAGPAAPLASAQPGPVDPELAKLATEFRARRAVHGHFGSQSGQWNEAVDAPGGRKYVVMDELRKRLGDGKYEKDQIIALLGPADEIALPGSMTFRLVMGQPHPTQIDMMLVYYWRGAHDLVAFKCQGPVVTGASWWMAGE